MPLDLSSRLVVGVASSALFDISEACAVFDDQGEEPYRDHQRAALGQPHPKGLAFAFIERLLALNALGPADEPLVEVVLLSRNAPDTGLRAMRSIEAYGLPITRAAFLSGGAPHRYLSAYDCELFLSANEADVRAAIAAGAPAGLVLHPGPAAAPGAPSEANDAELRIAFDFDGVLVDDTTEKIYAAHGVDAFRAHEDARRDQPLSPGPLKPFLDRIAALQARDRDRPEAERRIRTALVTARAAPAHERAVATLESWGVRLDEAFFLGGVEKTAVLSAFRPHIFFDDQRVHLDRAAGAAPAVHIPFGVRNSTPAPPGGARASA